jgi:hypothetical protein
MASSGAEARSVVVAGVGVMRQWRGQGVACRTWGKACAIGEPVMQNPLYPGGGLRFWKRVYLPHEKIDRKDACAAKGLTHLIQ